MKKIFLIFLACVMMLSGCSRKVEISNSIQETICDESIWETTEDSIDKSDETDLLKEMNQFKNVTALQYAGQNRVFMAADKMVLYDLSAHTILYAVENPGYTEALRLFPISTGYAIVDEMEGEDGNNAVTCSYYDASLNLIETVNINDRFALGPSFSQEVAVSGDGTQIAVSDTTKGLYLCDRESGQKREILSFAGTNWEDRKGICSVDQVGFTNQDRKITFLSSSFDLPVSENEQSFISYGSIDIDGKNLTVEKGNEFSRMQVYDWGAVFSEDIPFQGPKGETYIYTAGTGETKQIKLKETLESQYVWASDQGNWIMTALKTEGGWKVRLYHIVCEELMQEAFCKVDKAENYREPWLYLNEDEGTLLLYFRPYDDDTQYKIESIHVDLQNQVI